MVTLTFPCFQKILKSNIKLRLKKMTVNILVDLGVDF